MSAFGMNGPRVPIANQIVILVLQIRLKQRGPGQVFAATGSKIEDQFD
jgi:hypothetical protein